MKRMLIDCDPAVAILEAEPGQDTTVTIVMPADSENGPQSIMIWGAGLAGLYRLAQVLVSRGEVDPDAVEDEDAS